MKKSIVNAFIFLVLAIVYSLGFVALFHDKAWWVYVLSGSAFSVVYSIVSSAISRRNSRVAA